MQLEQLNAKDFARAGTRLIRNRRALNEKSERIELLTWRQIWSDLALRQALTWQSMVIFVPLGCIAATVYDHNRLRGSDEAWVLTGIAGYLVAIVAMLLLRAYSRVNRYRRSFTMLAGFALVGLARGLIVYEVGRSFGLIPNSELGFRALGSAFLFVWLLAGANVVITAAAKYRDAVEKLKNELAYLAGTRTALSKNIETVSRQLHTRINSVLVPAVENLVAKLKNATSKSADAAVLDLEEIIERVVRPLSHNVSKPSFLIDSSESVATVKPNTFIEVLRGNVALGDVILPTFVSSAAVLTALPSTIITMPPLVTLAVAVAGWLSVYAFLSLARYSLKDLFMPIWLSSLLAFFLPMLAGSGVIIGGWGKAVGIPEAAGPEFFTLAASISFAAFWFQVLELKRAQSLRELSSVTEEQRLLVSAMRQEIWVLQRHLAATLHGPVQAALFSSLIKFGQSEQLKEAQVAELIDNLQSSMAQLDAEPGLDRRAFIEVWSEIVDFWDGACELESNIDESLINEIATSAQALSCATEVIRESINNAVRHGEASKVFVELKVDSSLLRIKVRNNGKPMNVNRIEGLGSELIREVTHSSELVALQNDESGWVTELRATVVLSPIGQLAQR